MQTCQSVMLVLWAVNEGEGQRSADTPCLQCTREFLSFRRITNNPKLPLSGAVTQRKSTVPLSTICHLVHGHHCLAHLEQIYNELQVIDQGFSSPLCLPRPVHIAMHIL